MENKLFWLQSNVSAGRTRESPPNCGALCLLDVIQDDAVVSHHKSEARL